MRILLAISLVAFAALLWASISIAQHVRQARRKRRHDLAERARLRAENAIARASQPQAAPAETAPQEIPVVEPGHPVPPPPIPEPAPLAQPARAKLTYFKWDEADSDSEDLSDGRAPSASGTDEDHAAIPVHAARQANELSGNSVPAHKER